MYEILQYSGQIVQVTAPHLFCELDTPTSFKIYNLSNQSFSPSIFLLRLEELRGKKFKSKKEFKFVEDT